MRRRVVSFCAVLLCIICFITSGRTYASDIWTVDENLDPWAELEELQSVGADSGSDEDEEFESAFLGLEDTDFFGYTAVLDDGSVVENGGVAGIDTYATNTGFTGRFMSDVTFGGSWFSTSTTASNINWPVLVATHSPTPFSAFGSDYPWSFQTKGMTNLSATSKWWAYSGSTQYHVFISFTDMADSELESITLKGSITARLRPFFSSYSSLVGSDYNGQYPAVSAHLIAYYGSSETPSILKSFSISNGVVSFGDTTIDINRSVREIGIRFIFSNLPTSGASIFQRSSGTVNVNGWELYLAKGSSSYEYNGGPNSTGTDMSETNGLLSGLIAWVQGIYNTVVSIPGQIASIISGITELPGKLWALISDGLKGLFIPSDQDLQAISDKYNGLFEQKLGFIYQMFSFVVDTFSSIKDTLAAADNYSFHFPGVAFPMDGNMVVIIPEQDVSLDNAVMDVIRPVLGTIVTIVCVLSILSLGFDMVIAVLSGKSYSQFIGESREDLDI